MPNDYTDQLYRDLIESEKRMVEATRVVNELRAERDALKAAVIEFTPYLVMMSRSSRNRETPLLTFRAQIREVVKKYEPLIERIKL